MKVKKSAHINPFGGINFVFDSFNQLGIDKILQASLPELPNQSKYNWKDILYSFWSIYFCGGDCIEDIGLNQKDHLAKNPLVNIPSPDSISRRFKSLSTRDKWLDTKRGKHRHQFNINISLNKLLLQILNRSRLIKADNLICDYDNTVITTNKLDSKRSYLKTKGYQPGIGFLNYNVAYIENRNGNSDAQTLQKETLERMFSNFKAEGIKVKKFRADSGSYLLAVLQLLDKEVDNFYIKARKIENLMHEIPKIKEWKAVKIKNKTLYRGELKFKPFEGSTATRNKVKAEDLKTYRFIVTKEKRRDGQINLLTGEAYVYSIVVTNDEEMAMDEVVKFYNQRGKTEREFDALKNDFGWKNLSFSKLKYNTVFLIFTAIGKNLYQYIIKDFSKKYKNLKSNFRTKKFIFRFISIPAKWIKHGGQKILKIYGDPYLKT